MPVNGGEAGLYPPVKAFLEEQGWSVRGEVAGWDLLAVRNGEVLAVELKLGLTLRLLLQAVDRLEAADLVYIAVPFQRSFRRKRRTRVLKLLRMLGIGLLTVDPSRDLVQPELDPGPYRPRTSRTRREMLLREHAILVGDPNRGGGTRRGGVMTHYRHRALKLAAFLERNGPSKASEAGRETGDPEARMILYRNVYGWFARLGHGLYSLSERGARELPLWQGKPVPDLARNRRRV